MKRIITNPSRIAIIAITGLMGLLCASCVSVPTADSIPADLSPAKFFQVVQEQVDADQFESALIYLGEFRKRFGTSTDQAILDRMVEADYLTAHIAYSQGKLSDARDQFAAILKQYDGVPEEAVSPPRWIKILSKRLIESLDKKLGPKETTTTLPADAGATPAAPVGETPKP